MSIRNDDDGAIDRARELRTGMTVLEKGLWFRLRKEQTGFRFRRQHPVRPNYTLDFYCPEVKLCVEIDGPQHDPVLDERRDMHLFRSGIKTLRFKSQVVYDDMDLVVEAIKQECLRRKAG